MLYIHNVKAFIQLKLVYEKVSQYKMTVRLDLYKAKFGRSSHFLFSQVSLNFFLCMLAL